MMTAAYNNRQIPGYDLIEVIHTSVNTIIYRGNSTATNIRVIIKALNNDYPTIEAIARLKHEYLIAQTLDSENVVKLLRLEIYGHQLALIFEDFGGVSLKQYLETRKLSLIEQLEIIVAITKALIYLHSNNIIHKDIKPANIIINPETKEVKLTDLSIASKLSKEIPQLVNPESLEGTLSYLSPEQTGRMNRCLDYRSDFYSLGVTLYELLTGELPYRSNDPLELVHCHIAVEPKPIQILNPDIPSTLCNIVGKLMAKNAEDRYQSGKGILADLESCLRQLENTQTIIDFIPGELDILSQLLIPQKLYGREEQVTSLVEAFERVTTANKNELVLVSGYSGIGKTSVINEVNKPITKSKGYFISGKFDQFKRDIPYASLIQAFSSLVQQILTESAEKLSKWKAKILNHIGYNGQIIVDVIPEVALIIGSQPEVPQLPPTEAQNRFNRVFQEFIKVFCLQEHPLVIFLDDLQWADTGTLKLMQLLITNPEIKNLLIIGAYRNNEVSAIHPLITTIEEIKKAGTVVNDIVLQPLELASVFLLVAETLKDKAGLSDELAELIFHKTGGNPFFITQLLQALFQESLLIFDFEQRQWQWDLSEIQSIGITDNTVVQLVASRIQKLPESSQEIIKLAACIGDKFNLDVLSIINNKSSYETARQLDTALKANLILPLNQSYRLALLFADAPDVISFESQRIRYKFLHDQVQQAAYSLIPDSNKQATHLRIGRLLRSSSQNNFADNILDIVNQLNYGIELLQTDEEKYDLANLNLMSGRKAKNNSAFDAALKYFNIGLDLLAINSWKNNYNLTLYLYIETAESEYLNGNFDKCQQLINISLTQCKNILDKVKFYEIQIQSHTAKGEIVKALNIGVIALRSLGLNLPKSSNFIHIIIALAQTKLSLLSKNIEELENLSEISDPYKLAIMKMLILISPVASQSGSLLFPLMILAMVRLSVQYGNSIFAAYAYSGYGVMLCDKFGDIESGYRFGQLGIKLLSKTNANSLKAKVYLINFAMIKHFKDPVSESTSYLLEGMQSGLETGDIIFSTYNAFQFIIHLFCSNINLELLDRELLNCLEIRNNNFNESYTLSFRLLQQTILNLQGLSFNKLQLVGDAFNEFEMLASFHDNSLLMSNFCLCKAKISYFFGDYETAIKASEESKKYQKNNPSFLMYLVSNFYHSLSLIANYQNTSDKNKKLSLQQVITNQKKMKLWAHHAPCNFQHKYDLIEAEKARILGQNSLATELYERAIFGAKQNNYIAEEALANELVAKFYLEQSQEKIARVYMTDAYYGYIKWGAFAKVQDLESNYPSLIIPSTFKSKEIDVSSTISTSINTKNRSTTDGNQILDLASVMKASSAIQANMVIETLPYHLLRIIIQNAAAQRGCMLLEKNNEFYIEAVEDITIEDTFVLQSIPFDQSDIVPHSVINYVSRTQQPLVIHDAALDPITKNDAYILKYESKSILCLPIQYQGKSIGVFYIENNLASGAFTPKRLELIKILAAQAAISITNARLFSREKQKSQQLQESLEQLEITQGQLMEKAEALENALSKLQETQGQLVHTEKISALGQLVAGVAHEVNNPVSFIAGNLSHANQYVEDLVNVLNLYREKFPSPGEEILEEIKAVDLEYLLEDLPKMLDSMKFGTVRIKDIMQSLRNFSRNDGTQKRTADIHEGIDSTILILGYRLKAGPTRPAITIIKEYADIRKVDCYPGALNQVFMNLLSNAIDAMEESNAGKTYQEIEKNPNAITIRTSATDGYVCIAIKDNGLGMSDTTKQKLFEAFYTTKPEGKGTGLGLSISYKIITEQHGGKLEVYSSSGDGTEFVIMIPFV